VNVAAEMEEVMVQKCLSHQIPTIQVAAKVVHQCRSCLSKWHHCSGVSSGVRYNDDKDDGIVYISSDVVIVFSTVW
jgi:hypothetical protein